MKNFDPVSLDPDPEQVYLTFAEFSDHSFDSPVFQCAVCSLVFPIALVGSHAISGDDLLCECCYGDQVGRSVSHGIYDIRTGDWAKKLHWPLWPEVTAAGEVRLEACLLYRKWNQHKGEAR